MKGRVIAATLGAVAIASVGTAFGAMAIAGGSTPTETPSADAVMRTALLPGIPAPAVTPVTTGKPATTATAPVASAPTSAPTTTTSSPAPTTTTTAPSSAPEPEPTEPPGDDSTESANPLPPTTNPPSTPPQWQTSSPDAAGMVTAPGECVMQALVPPTPAQLADPNASNGYDETFSIPCANVSAMEASYPAGTTFSVTQIS